METIKNQKIDPLLVSLAAKDSPEKIALITSEGTLSFKELFSKIKPICHYLHTLPQNTLVALQASNRLETLLVIYSLLECKIPFVPIHPRLTEGETRKLCHRVLPNITLLDDENIRQFVKKPERVSFVSGLKRKEKIPKTLLGILFTSGTEGVQKGALLSRDSFIASALASAKNLFWQANDCWLACLPICHIGGLSILTRCLIARQSMCLLPRFEADSILEAIKEKKCTLLSLVPTMLHRLLEVDHENILARLRAILIGGASAPSSLLERAIARGQTVLATYGLTEACSQVSTQRVSSSLQSDVGYPLSSIKLSIQNASGQPLAPGEIGQICLQGESLMTGYFAQTPLETGEWFLTGDIGSLSKDGRLSVYTRRSDLIIRGGENVYPAEVEEALLCLPFIRSAIVFGVPDPEWGQCVAAVLVLKEKEHDKIYQLEKELVKYLATFKCPSRWYLAKELPQNFLGKPDRKRAISLFAPLVALLSSLTIPMPSLPGSVSNEKKPDR